MNGNQTNCTIKRTNPTGCKGRVGANRTNGYEKSSARDSMAYSSTSQGIDIELDFEILRDFVAEALRQKHDVIGVLENILQVWIALPKGYCLAPERMKDDDEIEG